MVWSGKRPRHPRGAPPTRRADVGPGNFLAAQPLAGWVVAVLAVLALASCISDVFAVATDPAGPATPGSLAVTITSVILLSLGPVVAAAGSWVGSVLVLVGAGLQLFDPLPLLPLFALVVTAFLVALTATPGFARLSVALAGGWMVGNAVVTPAGPLLLLGLLPMLLLAHVIGARLNVLGRQNAAAQWALADQAQAQRHAIVAERRAIARDLHDIVAHEITIISMQANAARVSQTEQQTEASLLAISTASRQALDDMRTMLRVLTTAEVVAAAEPLKVPGQTLAGEVAKAEQTLKEAGYQVSLSVQGDVAGVPRALHLGLIPVIRESVTNVLKHAAAGCAVHASLDVTRTEIRWRITNPHTPAAKERPGAGLGLVGLTERMELLAGDFHAEATDGQWLVSATLYQQRAAQPGSPRRATTVAKELP